MAAETVSRDLVVLLVPFLLLIGTVIGFFFGRIWQSQVEDERRYKKWWSDSDGR